MWPCGGTHSEGLVTMCVAQTPEVVTHTVQTGGIKSKATRDPSNCEWIRINLLWLYFDTQHKDVACFQKDSIAEAINEKRWTINSTQDSSSSKCGILKRSVLWLGYLRQRPVEGAVKQEGQVLDCLVAPQQHLKRVGRGTQHRKETVTNHFLKGHLGTGTVWRKQTLDRTLLFMVWSS